MKKFKRHLVTAALPYANGPVHIGHLAGVYIPADIYSRYLRLKGNDIIYICGSDEHGVPITIKARQEGVAPQQIVDQFHELNKKSFERFGISFDIYHRTTHPTHHKTASEFFKTLYDRGEFSERETEQYYDMEAGQYLADRYITGTCPRCSFESAYGDQCEQCGSSLNATDLINPKSTISGSIPVLKKTRHWYLQLERYEDFLRNWILEENRHWKTNVYGQCKSWIDGGLEARAVTRDLDWGIPVPIEGVEGKVLYVWFDAPIGYISATKDLTDRWEDYWKSDDCRLVHFIGKDNIVFHCIIFPSMLKAEGSYILPDNVPANEFLNLEGDKISTSRNWAVWLHEYLDEFPDRQDVLRYVLCANAPESKDNDFTWKDFQSRNNNELVAILGNFVHRTLVLTHKYSGGSVPKPENLASYDKKVLESIPGYRDRVEDNLEHFRFREALREAMNLARLGNKYLADTEPWIVIKKDPERVHNILYTCLQITAGLTALIQPFLPYSAMKLLDFLNIESIGWDQVGDNSLLLPGHKIRQPELLFEKVEDDVIQVQLDKLENNKKKNDMDKAGFPSAKPDISYEEFQRMDIRIARILHAERVPKTDKLLKVELDTGIDKRTVITGIAEYFDPGDLIGKQVSLLANLAPRKIRGVESHGMILLAEEADGKLIFVTPEEGSTEGAVIK
jgi:methionyl-tRNA synthetase